MPKPTPSFLPRLAQRLLAPLGYGVRPKANLAEEQRARETLAARNAVLSAKCSALRGRLDGVTGRAEQLARRLEGERQARAAMKAALGEKLAAARALHAAERSRAQALADELSALQARQMRLGSDLAASGRRRSPARGADEARALFEQGRRYQLQGAIDLAVASYAQVGPRISEFLTQPRADGKPTSGPDFIIIGNPRAGTTWIKKRLAHHPQVFILMRELHYFSHAPHVAPETYVGMFCRPQRMFLRPSGKPSLDEAPEPRLFGEKSPDYLTMPDAYLDLCAVLFPKARLICTVREPVSRAWSHIKHLGLAEQASSLDRLQWQPLWASLDTVVEHGFYERHLRRWARRFPPDQMLLVDFARLASEPEEVLAEVVRHIGAQPGLIAPDLDSIGATDEAEMPRMLRDHLEEAYRGETYDVGVLRASMIEAAEAERRASPRNVA